MAIGDETPFIYNEPLQKPTSDVVPKSEVAAADYFNRYVRARLELERRLLVCGVDPNLKSLEFTEAHAEVLLIMLQELDSPYAARLRTQAATWAGPYELKGAATVLRKIALDANDDLQTRLNAIASYIGMVGDEACEVIEELLTSTDLTVRTTVYVVALRHRGSKIAELALERLKSEKNPRVRTAVSRRSPVLQERSSTKDTKHPEWFD